MDVVIPFMKSINRDQELRFALRGLEQSFTDVGQVWLIGDEPRWAHSNLNVIQIKNHFPQYHYRDRNIAIKLLSAANMQDVSDEFLVLHDDNFLNLREPLSLNDWPHYHCVHNWNGIGYYALTEENTRELFRNDPMLFNFDLHAPHSMEKGLLKRSVGRLDWTKRYGYCIKTVYCYMNGIRGVADVDCKIRVRSSYSRLEAEHKNRQWFSAHDFAWNKDLVDYLTALFPKPSKYESY